MNVNQILTENRQCDTLKPRGVAIPVYITQNL